jgi:hypothetical protein
MLPSERIEAERKIKENFLKTTLIQSTLSEEQK